jgi:hypothetical protein
MPLKFWDEAFSTAAYYLTNRLPSRVINFASPLEKLFNAKPDYTWLKTFGCACWPHLRPYNTRKLEFRSKRFVFLGYNSSHKGYKSLDVAPRRVYVSHDVVFDESVFSFSNLHPNVGPQLHAEIMLLRPTLRNSHEDVLVDDHRANGANLGSEFNGVQGDEIIGQAASQYAASSSIAQQQGENVAEGVMDPVGAVDPGVSVSNLAPIHQPGSTPDPMPTSSATTESVAMPSPLNMCSALTPSPAPAPNIVPGFGVVGGSDGHPTQNEDASSIVRS